MNTIQLIKSKKPTTLYSVVSWLFVLSGANFFMNYILPTNPQSRNKFIRKLWNGATYKDPIMRYQFAYVYGGIHLVFLIINISNGEMWDVWNILSNVYPIIVQLYIGYRCYRIKNHKLISNT